MPCKKQLTILIYFIAIAYSVRGGTSAYADDEDAFIKKISDLLDAATILIKADENPGSADAQEIESALQLLDHGLRNVEELRGHDNQEYRDQLFAAVMRSINLRSARWIIYHEIFGHWIERTRDGQEIYQPYPSRALVLQKLADKLGNENLLAPDVVREMAESFINRRASIFISSMDEGEAALYSLVKQHLAQALPNDDRRRRFLLDNGNPIFGTHQKTTGQLCQNEFSFEGF